MEPIILAKQKDIYKIITAVLIALVPIHPFFTLYSDWPLVIKTLAILGFLGFKSYYAFEDKKEYIKTKFLNITVSKTSMFEIPPHFVRIHKSLNETKYELRLGTEKTYKSILRSKDYFYISNMASQLSHLLHLDLYNPFEDYD